MPKSQVQNHQELNAWITEGRPYSWIIDKYQEKYGITLKPTMLANYRRRHGLPPRNVRDDKLIPWYVKPEHRKLYRVEMLRMVARMRAGAELTEREQTRVTSFLENLRAANAVITYEPASEEGFYYVPRLPEDDDIIRRPEKVTKRLRREQLTPQE
jgi:hypothetical protein